jgi:hypothetical protein
MGGPSGGGALRVPRGETGRGTDGIGEVAEQPTSADELIRQRRATKESTGPGIKATAPDGRGLLGGGDQFPMPSGGVQTPMKNSSASAARAS